MRMYGVMLAVYEVLPECAQPAEPLNRENCRIKKNALILPVHPLSPSSAEH